MKGFRLRSGQFPPSSSNRYESGESLLPLSVFRFLATNCSAEKNLGLDDDALRLYEDMMRIRPLPSVTQFNQLLSRVVKLKEYSAAIHIFKGICNLGMISVVSEYTMTIAINCYCLSGRVDYGFSILGWFFKRGRVPNAFTYSTLLKGLFREHRIPDAQELFRKMVREDLCELDVVTYGTVIDGLCKAGNTQVAIQLLKAMERGKCKLNTHIYSMIIDALCKDSMIDSALMLFREMYEKGIPPNVITFNALVCGLCKLSRWRELKLCLKQMVDCKIHPNVVTYSILVDALCKEGLVGEAEDVIQIMKQQNVVPNVVSYNSLMDGYCLQGRMDEARNVFDSMASTNIPPTIQSYNILMDGFCRETKIDIFHEMPRKGIKPNETTYAILVQGLFGCGRFFVALKLFDELKDVGLKPTFYIYCNMLDGLCKNDQVERASLLLDALEHEGEEHLHISYYNIIMDGFCKAKNLNVARAIFRDLPRKGLDPDVITYNIMVNGCCQDGLLEEAQDFLLKMEKASLSPDRITYNSMVQGNLKKGEYEVASKLFDEMWAKRFSPDASTFELMLGLLGTKKHNPTLFQMFQKFAPNTLRPES